MLQAIVFDRDSFAPDRLRAQRRGLLPPAAPWFVAATAGKGAIVAEGIVSP